MTPPPEQHYHYHLPPPQPRGPENGMGTTALILGITGAALSVIPWCLCLSPIACVVAIVFGAIGISTADSGRATNRNAAKAGFILGITGLGITALFVAIGAFPWN